MPANPSFAVTICRILHAKLLSMALKYCIHCIFRTLMLCTSPLSSAHLVLAYATRSVGICFRIAVCLCSRSDARSSFCLAQLCFGTVLTAPGGCQGPGPACPGKGHVCLTCPSGNTPKDPANLMRKHTPSYHDVYQLSDRCGGWCHDCIGMHDMALLQ